MSRRAIVPFFIAHEGCPHRCVFCDQRKISGATEPLPSPEQILQRVEAYRGTSRGESVEVAFYGGTFTSLPLEVREALLQPLQPLVRTGRVAGVRVSTRPDAVDGETAVFLRQRGVTVVELGVQSLDDHVLRLSGRGHAARDVVAAVTALRREDFLIGLQLMTGLPGDTPQKSVASLERTLALSPDFLRIYPALVIAGTELERRYRSGEYVPATLDEAVSLCGTMLRMARAADVPVVRIGLQATGELQPSASLVAGPYHPAFRHLVQSHLCYEDLAALTEGMTGAVTVLCAPGGVSDVTGQRRCNIERLATERGITIASVREDERLAPFELRVEQAEARARRGSKKQHN